MGNIFICYRREDSQLVTDRIFDHLANHFSRKSLFKDVDNIPPGVDFRTHVDNAIRRSAVMLAIIGPGWLSARDAAGGRRLDDPADFVHVELSSALQLKRSIIPVLVGGARMPTADELPPALKPLAYINAVPVRSDPDFAGDFERLRRVLGPIAGRWYRGWTTRAAIAAVALSVVIAVAWYAVGPPLPSPASFPRDGLRVRIAEYPQPKKTVWLDQNLSKEKRSWFYHADQGTRTFGIPFEWFVALEQPVISLMAVDLFSDPAYLDRYGFIPDSIVPGKNTLPIGFARGGPMSDQSGGPWRNPSTKTELTGIGLTCAACHTGRFTYKDTAVIIDGGAALADYSRLKQGMGLALFLTRFVPGRFGRFADRVVGPDSTDDARETLKYQLDQVLKQYKQVDSLEQAVASQSIEEGYGRLDALNRIGNQVFSLDLKKPENYRGSSAPVHYPRIWNTPWFEWAQYNGSFKQPMVRNVGKSLGLSADLDLTDPSRGLFKSSVNFRALYEIEQLVAGDPPSTEKGFSGLKSPKWPSDVLPPIDENLAAQGAELYKTTCLECHRPPVTDKAFFDFNNKDWWTTNQVGQPILKIDSVTINHIGTDSAQATDMSKRTVTLPSDLGISQSAFGLALSEVVTKAVKYLYDQQKPPLSDQDRRRINGNMPNDVRAEPAYKARPLNGIWATPPYLHNGSVPTIEALLGPVMDRPKMFYLGNREYDPVNLGYETGELTNGFLFDTSIRGNYNTGHEFTDDERARGRVGPALSSEQRRALIEYVKTL